MSYELFIAKRYLRSKRKTGFISLITYFTVLGVMIGVAALIIGLSIHNGFETTVRSRFIGFSAHIEVRRFHNEGFNDYKAVSQVIKSIDHVVGISPYITDKGIIMFKSKKSGAVIKAIEPETVDQVSDLRERIVYGKFEVDLVQSEGNRRYPGIVLGRYLAEQLRVDLGDKVHFVSPTGLSIALGSAPKVWPFVVTGFFETGLPELDSNVACISIKQAQRVFEIKGQVSGLEVRLDDMDYADEVAEIIEEKLEYPYTARTWFELRKTLFSWIEHEKMMMYIVLSLIIMVAAFNIVSTLIMIVLEKTKDIGILKSMGATSASITKIFIFEGLTTGIVGTILGCVLGYLLCWLQLTYEFFSLPADVYIISALPILMKGTDFFIIASTAIVICFLATIYPALKAAKLLPVESIRYE